MKKKILIITIVLVLVIGGGYIALKSMSPDPDNIIINNIDLSNVEDGIYIGKYKTTMVSAKVQVAVKNNEINDIKILEHECGTGTKAEIIVDDVVNTQSLDVDTVSGATLSSKVILKAVENAILQ